MSVNFLIIGFGGMGSMHYRNLEQSFKGRVKVKGIFDIDKNRGKYAEELGLIAYKTQEEALSDKDIDAVIIATPNDVHMEIVCAAAAKGKHIICEKPVALGLRELEKMQSAALKNGVVFTVHQNRRWDKDFSVIKKIIEKEMIGGVYKIESRVMGSNGIPGEWRKFKRHGGGMLYDWGVHLIDQILCLTDSPVKSVICTFKNIIQDEVDESFYLGLEFENGLDAQIEVDTNSFINLPRWFIKGIDGSAVIEDWNLNGRLVRVKQREDSQLQGVMLSAGFSKTMAPRSPGTFVTRGLPEPDADVKEFWENFLECVKSGSTELLAVKVSGVQRVLSVIECAFESARTGQKIYLKN